MAPDLDDYGHDVASPFAPDPDAPVGFELRGRTAGGEFVVARGERVLHSWLQDRGFAKQLVARAREAGRLPSTVAEDATTFIEDPYSVRAGDRWLDLVCSGAFAEEHPRLGPVCAVGDLEDVDLTALLDFEVEFTGIADADGRTQAAEILTELLGPGLAEQVADLTRHPFLGWASPWPLPVPPDLAARGVRGFDLRLATHRLESYAFCLRNLRLVWSDAWLVCFWGPPLGDAWDEVSGYCALPGRGRPYDGRSTPGGTGGEARCASKVQDVIWHNEWSAVTLAAQVELWESRFYEATAEPPDEDLDELLELGRRLAWLGRFASDLHIAQRTLHRRATTFAEFPADIAEEVCARSVELERRATSARDGVRQGFALLTAVASSKQAEDAGQFQTALSWVTALVLVPGLVFAAYGADVRGLPGFRAEAGLRVMAVAAAVGAVVTLVAMWSHRRWARRRRRRRRTRTGTAAEAVRALELSATAGPRDDAAAAAVAG